MPTPQGQISINPASAPPATRVMLSGQGLPANQTLQVVFDGNPLDSLFTDGSGNFAKEIAIPDTATGSGHQICVVEPSQGNVCANFTLQAPQPSPTPQPSPNPTPSPNPSPEPVSTAGATGAGGSTPLAALMRPPFVFFPIVLLLAGLAWLAWYLWSMRPVPAIGEVTVLHTAVPARIYEPAPPPPPAATPPAPPPVFYEEPRAHGPAPPPPPRAAPPSGADVPPDLPEASD